MTRCADAASRCCGPLNRRPLYGGYICDLDGTIYLGERLIPGAQEKILNLRAAGSRVVFLSNKPLEPRESYAAKLTRLGIPTPPEDVINSTRALAHYLRQHHAQARLFVIGETPLLDEMRREGFTLTDDILEIEIVVAAFDRTLDYRKLNTAHQALVRGARFFATNSDKTCPIEGGAIPDCAGVIAFLEATSERHVEMVAGKPSPLILQAALDRLGLPKEQCLMVGDRLGTDMAMGLQQGVATALVLTGVTTRQMLAESGLLPTHVVESIADIS
jgi:NagD protein